MKTKWNVLFTIAIYSLVSHLSAVAAQEKEWRTIRPSGAEFSAEFPGRPTREARLLPDLDPLFKGNVHDVVVYNLVSNNIRYEIISFSKVFASRDKFEGSLDSFAVGFERASLTLSLQRKDRLLLKRRQLITPDNIKLALVSTEVSYDYMRRSIISMP